MTNWKEQFHRMKADPLKMSTDEVRAFSMQKKWQSKAGNMTIKVQLCDRLRKSLTFGIIQIVKYLVTVGCMKILVKRIFSGK